MQHKKTGFSLKNLSVQINLIVIGISTVVLMGFGLYQVRSMTRYLKSNQDAWVKNEVVQISASLSTALFNFDDDTCKVIVTAALNKPEITRIIVSDQNDIYLTVGTGGDGTGQPDRHTRVIQAPIVFSGEQIGRLELWVTSALMESRVAALKRSILLKILVIDIVLALVLALVFLLRFVRPLKSLEKGSEQIAAGDLNYPIDVVRQDEIGSLAANLIIMRDAVREKVVSLEAEVLRHEQTALALKTSKEYMDSIINSMPSMLIGLDSDMKITHWNRRACEMTGTGADQAVGRFLFDVAERFSDIQGDIRQTIETGKIFIKARQPRSLEEKTVYEDVAVYPLVSEHAGGAVIRVDDVTDLVRMEQMVVQSEKMMSVGGLAAGMAHEINNPLAGMMQNAQVVLTRIKPDVPANVDAARQAGTTMAVIRMFMEKRGIIRQLEAIRQAGVRASQIVQNMLSFSRQDNLGKASQSLVEILDLSLDLARSDYDLKKQYDFKTIDIQREYEQGCPPVVCESSRIQQVFFNLLKNSAQALQEARQKDPDHQGKIIVRTFKAGDEVVVEIEDNGPGMKEPVRKRAFEPFFTTKPVGQGTGLGLSVSYFIVTENHGGKMRVVSTPGKGTTFIVHLPAA